MCTGAGEGEQLQQGAEQLDKRQKNPECTGKIARGGSKKKIVSAGGWLAYDAIEPPGSIHLNKICIFGENYKTWTTEITPLRTDD